MKSLKKINFEELSEKFTTISNENLSVVIGGLAMSSLCSDTDGGKGMSSLFDDSDPDNGTSTTTVELRSAVSSRISLEAAPAVRVASSLLY